MMKIPYQKKADGPGPQEAIVSVNTADGEEELILDRGQLDSDGSLLVGVVAENDTGRLVELPRESVSGNWRVWVPR